jgi:hypothetical protein
MAHGGHEGGLLQQARGHLRSERVRRGLLPAASGVHEGYKAGRGVEIVDGGRAVLYVSLVAALRRHEWKDEGQGGKAVSSSLVLLSILDRSTLSLLLSVHDGRTNSKNREMSALHGLRFFPPFPPTLVVFLNFDSTLAKVRLPSLESFICLVEASPAD